MLKRLSEFCAGFATSRRNKKKEFFTIVILPGPNSKVHKFSISRTLLRNAGIAIIIAVLTSCGMFGQYFRMLGKVCELDSLRRQTVEQKAQLMQVAGTVVDMKGQMARLKQLSDKLSSVANTGGKKNQQFLGIGGSSEINSINLNELGKKTHKEMAEEMSRELNNLKGEANEQETALQKLTSYFEHRNSILSSTPSIWPVHGFITSEFGYRSSPVYGTKQFHEGLDIANAVGTPIDAPANGTVVEMGYSSGYGRYIKIQHGYGMTTLYGHLSKTLVREGQRVKKGEVIGNIGNTGSSTGPHLHYEVWINGVPTNPRKYI